MNGQSQLLSAADHAELVAFDDKTNSTVAASPKAFQSFVETFSHASKKDFLASCAESIDRHVGRCTCRVVTNDLLSITMVLIGNCSHGRLIYVCTHEEYDAASKSDVDDLNKSMQTMHTQIVQQPIETPMKVAIAP
jgi:hypothetical protein